MESVEMKNFSFGMLDYKTKLFKKISKNVVATIKMTIRNINQIALRNKKTIINKRNKGYRNFEIF